MNSLLSSSEPTLGDARTAREIASAIETRIRGGLLGAGDKLPPIRSLAGDLSVSPTTVATAYRELRRRGLVTAAGRRGTRVSERPPVRAAGRASIPAGARDLASGNPDPAFLPPLGRALAQIDERPRLYGVEATLPALTDLARGQFTADGMSVPALTVLGGALDAIDRVLAAHLRPGDSVAVEDPGYARVFDLLRGAGLELLPVRVDDSGLVPDDLELALHKRAGAVVLTPRAQNPRGSALDRGRTAELRAVLERYPHVVVVEDDHAGVAAGAQALDVHPPDHPHWAISRSVSKTLGPDLRLAVVAGDAETIARVEGRRMLGAGWVSHIIQQLVVTLWSDQEAMALVGQAADVYADRRATLVAALGEHGIAAHGRSGMNVWIPVAEETAIVTGLLERGWAVMAGERWRVRTGPAIRITSAVLPTDEASRLAADVADITAHRGTGYST
jgi:DNA-binding transcriptional MocR family regulator